jgi:hypothetical protein
MDADAALWQFLSQMGVQTARLHALIDRLRTDFLAEEGGYRAFHDLPLLQRAIISDQVLGAAQATGTNLGETRMYEQDLGELLTGGVPFAEPSVEERERQVRVDMAFVGFFRAIGSCLDCLTAVTTGVLRLPFSIRRASFTQLLNLSDRDTTNEPWWTALKTLVDTRSDDPPGWLRWTLEMRNAYMHRARLMNLYLQRETKVPELALPSHVFREVLLERARFEAYFRRRPWLPDLQHLADSRALSDAIVTEPAIQTARGLFETTNGLVEDLAELLMNAWVDVEFKIPSPREEWAIESPLEVDFSGFASAPLPKNLSAMAINPRDAERVALATRLQQEKLL